MGCSTVFIALFPIISMGQSIDAPRALDTSAQTSRTPSSHRTVRLSRHTEVEVRLEEEISSKTAKVGQQVRFALDEDLTVKGHVIAKAGTPLSSTIVNVHPRDEKHDGKLTFSNLKLDLAGGQSIVLHGGTPASDIDDDTWAYVVGAIIIFPIGIAGLIMMAKEKAEEAKNLSRRLRTPLRWNSTLVKPSIPAQFAPSLSTSTHCPLRLRSASL